jgi:pyruvate dehydrogenase E2 component (dihydrolipoamide acetyltransferase)
VAQELGVDLSTVEGTGFEGAIERADVERAAQAAKGAGETRPPAPPAEDAYGGIRRAIAAAMARSNREIPHYYLETQIDMSAPMRWLAAQNQQRPVQRRLLPIVLLVKAVACALKQVPELNGYWKEDKHQPSKDIHIGFAVSLRQGGLVVPALLNTDRKNLDELMAAMSDLIQRTRAGRLRSSEITDGTITVTNLGDRGVETVYGVIYPPQVALVGFGRITERPWAENGTVGARSVLSATLAGDHRATDGRCGARFLEGLKDLLQQPEML